MTNDKHLNIGVVGLGSMGINHVRLYSGLKNIDKVFVFDTNKDKSKNVANKFGAIHVNSLKDMLSCDGVSISSPTETHYDVAKFFLENKVNCLVEKPLSLNYKEAKIINDIALLNKSILMVGHVEHFNPAFLELKNIIKNNKAEIFSIESRRLSYARLDLDKSVDVIFDLMIHDIELIVSLVGKNIKEISSNRSFGEDEWGHVSAICSSDNGTSINLTSSRITQNKIRTMDVNSSLGYFHLDFIKQELILNKTGFTENAFNSKDSIHKLEITSDKFFIRNEEPLRMELEHFISCIKDKNTPITNGLNASYAVMIAEKIKEKAFI